MSASPQSFYITGGNVPPDALSYVSRNADEILYAHLCQGEFCYILTSRQMGKSSLMAQTVRRFRATNIAVAVLDLSAQGSKLDAEQWYNGLLIELGRRLRLEDEVTDFCLENERLSPLQRWQRALRDVILERISGPVVVFIDEIDVVRSLPFAADEFFAAIRACYNARTEDPAYTRLTFCLLGVATPADLIRDARLTPFNIGKRIHLTDFTEKEASLLQHGLGHDVRTNRLLMERIYYWTGGHPCLTQRLCQAVMEDHTVHTQAGVDRCCKRLYFTPEAGQQDDNLTYVRQRMLYQEESQATPCDLESSGDDLHPEQESAALLTLYTQILGGRPVVDNEADALISKLKLSGVVQARNRKLQVRNRIYARVFDRAWVRAHMPDAELYRQRIAYWKGVFRAVFVSSGIFTPVTLFAIVAYVSWMHSKAETLRANQEADHAKQEQRHSQTLLYASDMYQAQNSYDRVASGRLTELLEEHRPNPSDPIDRRGFEWRYLWGLMHQDRHTFMHKGNSIVSSIAFSPRGKILASADEDGTIELWDYATCHEIAPLHGPTQGVFAIAFSPDGRQLATANLNKSVTLWDVTTQTVEATLPHKSEVYSVAFSPDGHRLVSGDQDGEVKFWDVASHHELSSYSTHASTIYAVAFSPDGRWLAIGAGSTLRLWAAPFTHKPVTLSSTQVIPALAFSPQSNSLVVSKSDGRIEIWNVRSQCKEIVLASHVAAVNGIAFSPDGRYLATGSWDCTIRLWNTATWKPIGQPFIGHTNRVTSVAFSSDGRWLASGGSKEVKIWDYLHQEQNPRRLATIPLRNAEGSVHSLIYSSNGTLQRFSCDGKHNVATLWDVATRTPVRHVPIPDQAVMVILSNDGKLLAIGTGKGDVIVLDVATHRQIWHQSVANPNLPSICALAFSSDGKKLAASNGDPAEVTVWDADSGQLQAHFQHTNSARGIAFSPDGNTLAAANWQGRVYLWDLTTKTLIDRWWAHAKPVNDVAFSPDGQTLATTSEDGTIKLWNLATHREMVTLTGPKGQIDAVTFSPDGNRLAALSYVASNHYEAWVWKAASLAEADNPITTERSDFNGSTP